MKYAIYITAAAEQDMIDASDYIEFILKNPTAADNLLDETDLKINSLSAFPCKLALIDDPLLASWGIRFIQIKNYLAFYVVSEEDHLVTIIRFLYRKSNWKSLLKSGFSLI